MITVASRALLAAISNPTDAAYLYENGREGVFVWNSADLSAQVGADPLQGLFVAPSTDTTGNSGAWERVFDGVAEATWYGCVADGATDDSAAINAALANVDTSIVILPAGVIGIQSPVVIPSGRILRGAGSSRTIVKVIPTFSKGAYKAAVIYPEMGSSDIGVEDLTADASNLYNGGIAGTPNRISGVLFEVVDGFWARDVHVKNCTGYGHYAAGALDGTNLVRNGYYENCYVENCNVNFEIQDGYNITYVNCHSTDGDGDNPSPQECHFHPYLACNAIRYYGCSAIGTGIGWYLINSGADQSDITLDGCKAQMSGGTGILVVTDGGFYLKRLSLINSVFQSSTAAGALLNYITNGEAIGCRFYSTTIDNQPSFGVVNYANSEMEFTACHGRGEATFGTVAGYGIANVSPDARWNGGKLEGKISGTATGAPLAMKDPIIYSANTRLIPPAAVVPLNEGAYQAVVNSAGTTVTLKSNLGWYRVVKTGGTNGGQDGYAGSAVNLSGDFVITAIPRITDDGAFAIGVSTAPGGGWTAMEAAFFHDGTGALGFGIPSAGLSGAGVYVPYEPLHLVRRAGIVTFYKGGATYLQGKLVGTRADANTVGFDLSLWKSNAAIDVRVGKL